MHFICLQAQIVIALRMKCTTSVLTASDFSCIFSLIFIIVEIQ